MRQIWLDNIRWVTVLLVLLFHVFYYFCACCNGSGIGGFTDLQMQDSVVYILYPWLMMLLFLVAGISSRLSLDRHTHKEFIRSRTRKLLVPATLGLFVFQWTMGYFGMHTIEYRQGIPNITEGLSPLVQYISMAISGTGVLWFIQLLWLFSLILVLIRIVEKDRLYVPLQDWLSQSKSNFAQTIFYFVVLALPFLLIWGSEQTIVDVTQTMDLGGLLNLYRPLVYGVCYLLGYYLFSNSTVLDLVQKVRWPMLLLSIVGAILITIFTFSEDPYSPAYLRSWYNNLYAWIVILTVVGHFRAYFNQSNSITQYLSNASFGIYVVHYVVVSGVGYMLRVYTTLPAWSMYVIVFVATFTLSPLIYEGLRRIPVVRYCVFGIKGKK